MSTCAERDQLLAKKQNWDASSSMTSSSEGGDHLQEILQGVREVKNHTQVVRSCDFGPGY